MVSAMRMLTHIVKRGRAWDDVESRTARPFPPHWRQLNRDGREVRSPAPGALARANRADITSVRRNSTLGGAPDDQRNSRA